MAATGCSQLLANWIGDGHCTGGGSPCTLTKHPVLSRCQSMTLHIGLCAFPTHLRCISKALPHTLMHCVSDSACYATPHFPLHPRLHTCRLCLFVCLPLSPVHVLLVLFVCFLFRIGSVN